MKKLSVYLFLSLFSFTTFQSCIYSVDNIPPRGVSIRTYDLRNFDQLEISHAFQVHVQSGSIFSVTATGELNDLDDLEIFTQEGKLVVRYDNSWHNRREMDIAITMPSLSAVDFSGAVDSEIKGFENLSKIDFELSGASKCDFIGSSKTFDFDLSGASKLYLSGDGQFLDGELSGASYINALNLPVQESDLKLSGASDAKVWVLKYLEVDASGASSVKYKGDPIIKQKLSGGSTLRRE